MLKARTLCTLSVAALFAACGGELIEEAQTSDALSNGAHGFAWVNISSGSPNASYSYNSAGGAITVASSGTGVYLVTFAGLGGSGGNVQVVAYGNTNTRCKVSNWYSGGGAMNIGVRCHNPAGAATNSAFIVQYARQDTNNGAGAHLFAGNPTAESYNPSSIYSWNSSGGINRIQRIATGIYDAFLPGLAVAGGSVQITAYGAGADHCKVQSWGPSGSEQRIRVRCFDTTGAASDAAFSLNFFGHQQVSAYDLGAYVWADNMSAASYTPSLTYSYNSGTINGWEGCAGWIGDNTAGRSGLGQYFVRHTILSPLDAVAHVTAYGSNASFCKVEGWGTFGDGTQVRIRCFDAAGAPVDSQFVEQFSSSWFRGPC